MRLIKQNDTSKAICFLLVSSTDHVSPVTGASPTVQISKNGGTFATPTGTISEIGNGWYKLTPAATDADTLGPLLIHATASGADPVDVEYQVVAFDPYLSDIGAWNLTIEGSLKAKELLALIASVLFGKSSGSGTGTLTFYAAGGTDERVVATLSAPGNRTDVTLTPP